MIGALLGILVICILAIAASSVIINIDNLITEYIANIKVDSKSADCKTSLEPLSSATSVISITRGISITILVIAILIFILVIAGLIFGGEEIGAANDIKKSASSAKSGLRGFLGSPNFYIVLSMLLLLVFIGFVVVYGIVLYNLNKIDIKCLSGSENDPKSELANFNLAKRVTIIHLSICSVLSLIFLIVLIFAFRSKVKSFRYKNK